MQALKHLNVRTTLIATAYKKTINQTVKKYYEDGGVEVVDIEGLEVSKPVDQVKLPNYSSYKVAPQSLQRHPSVERL